MVNKFNLLLLLMFLEYDKIEEETVSSAKIDGIKINNGAYITKPYTKVKKSPSLINQHVVRTYILLSEKLAKPHLLPNMFVIHNFLY
jgi:hypothetical protein